MPVSNLQSGIFLEIDGVKGESQNKKFPDTVDVMSVGWGASNAVSVGGTGLSGGVANFHDLSVTAPMDSAYPALIKNLATNKVIDKITVHGCVMGEEQLEIYKIELKKVLVSSVQVSAAGGGESRPTISYSFTGTEFHIEYTPQTDEGTLGSTKEQDFSIKKNA